MHSLAVPRSHALELRVRRELPARLEPQQPAVRHGDDERRAVGKEADAARHRRHVRDRLDRQFMEMVQRVLLSRGLYSLRAFREEGRYVPTHATERPVP